MRVRDPYLTFIIGCICYMTNISFLYLLKVNAASWGVLS